MVIRIVSVKCFHFCIHSLLIQLYFFMFLVDKYIDRLIAIGYVKCVLIYDILHVFHDYIEPWMRFLNLTGGDIRRLTSGKMLTDKHINAPQKLLVKEFRVFENFQNPLVYPK